MTRGAAEPVALKVLHGRGRGKDGRPRDSGGRAITPPPPFKRLAPEKPAGLTDLASAHWDAVVPEMERLELLTPGHIGGLVMMCESWSLYCLAMDEVRSGVLIDSPAGKRRNPAIIVANAELKEYRAWCQQFGLTPLAEGRLKPREADGDKDNPFA